MSLNLRPAKHVMAAIKARWPEVGSEWALAVPDELAELCARFNAVAVRALPARYGFVVAATSANGPLVLRASPDPAGLIQADISRALAEIGAGPKIHDVVATATGTWIAMEHIDPGTPLGQSDLSPKVISHVVNVLERMTGRPAPSRGMPRIDQWLRERLTDDRLADLAPGQLMATADERQRALSILNDLTDQGQWVLCHGDLHPGNVLVRADGRLFLIDPRGVSGEVAYDVAVFALKAVDGAPAAARAVAGQVAACVGVDTERARAWAMVASAARV